MSVQSKIIKKNAGKIANAGLALFAGKSTYDESRNEGSGVVVAGAKALGDFAVTEMLGLKGMLALGAAKGVPKGIIGGIQNLEAQSRSMNRASVSAPFQNATFVDSQQVYTMRQAGMNLAQASRYNLQQTLMGNEAQYMKF